MEQGRFRKSRYPSTHLALPPDLKKIRVCTMKRSLHFFGIGDLRFFGIMVWACLISFAFGEPSPHGKILGSGSCSTTGCHGGAGPNRGAFTLWKTYDPHTKSAATLGNGRSRAMATQLGIENPSESKTCTICHDPNQQISPSMFADPADREKEIGSISCANCHGAASNWLLSHTRRDYPKDVLARLGMRQLGSAYQRANNCVACHQNLSDKLVGAKHPPLVFELDGLLVAEPKHWRENENFSHTQTWLVGQAVALREAAAQAVREPSERRSAEIEAIKSLLKSSGTAIEGSGEKLVHDADIYAKRISSSPINAGQTRAILGRLLSNREPFQIGSFESLSDEYRMWAIGFYAERLALAIDRLNEAGAKIPDTPINALFDASKPPKGFNADAAEIFVRKLEAVAKSFPTIQDE